jgi:hypothetical protein
VIASQPTHPTPGRRRRRPSRPDEWAFADGIANGAPSESAGAFDLASTSLALGAMSAGFAFCMNVVHYRTWSNVGASDFAAYQDASALATVPAALAIGLPSVVWALRLARRGLPGVRRRGLAAAALLAVTPWIATPVYFVPLQRQLHDEGPASRLLTELSWADLVLRALPPLLQTVLVALALRRARRTNVA